MMMMEAHRSAPLSVMAVVLDQNEDLLAAIVECQRLGKPFRAVMYQRQLHDNIMILAQLCDNQDFFPTSFRQLAQDTLPRQSAPPPRPSTMKFTSTRTSSKSGSSSNNGRNLQQPTTVGTGLKAAAGAKAQAGSGVLNRSNVASAPRSSTINGPPPAPARVASPLPPPAVAVPPSAGLPGGAAFPRPAFGVPTAGTTAVATGGGTATPFLMPPMMMPQLFPGMANPLMFQQMMFMQAMMQQQQQQQLQRQQQAAAAAAAGGGGAGQPRHALVQTPLGYMKVQLVGAVPGGEDMNLPVVGQMSLSSVPSTGGAGAASTTIPAASSAAVTGDGASEAPKWRSVSSWSAGEVQKLNDALTIYKDRDYAKIAQYIGTKSRAHVRARLRKEQQDKEREEAKQQVEHLKHQKEMERQQAKGPGQASTTGKVAAAAALHEAEKAPTETRPSSSSASLPKVDLVDMEGSSTSAAAEKPINTASSQSTAAAATTTSSITTATTVPNEIAAAAVLSSVQTPAPTITTTIE